MLLADDVVTATFQLKTFALEVDTTGSGSGRVTSNPAGINCGSTCTHDYEIGKRITLTAAPDANAKFVGWGGACSGSQNTCKVTITDALSVTAEFALKEFTLEVQTDGPGKVTSNPAGINCGSTCTHDYEIGKRITLTAAPDANAKFVGWGGACSGSQNTCEVTITDALSVTAEFALKEFTLEVQTDGPGKVTSNPAGINCGSTCTHDYEIGKRITLTAAPDANAKFVGWGGACSGSQNTCEVTITDALSVTAEFALKEFTLEVQTDGPGKVTSNPAGINCGSTCAHDYEIGAQITLAAAPDANAKFVGWGGACSGSQNTCKVIITDALSVTAEFALKGFTLEVQTDGPGKVTSNPAGIDCGTQCSHTYAAGAKVTLSAQPSDGGDFDSWAGDCSGDKPVCTVIMSGNKAATAKFRLQRIYLPGIRR